LAAGFGGGGGEEVVRGVRPTGGDAVAGLPVGDALADGNDFTRVEIAGAEGVLHPVVPVRAGGEVAGEDDALRAGGDEGLGGLNEDLPGAGGGERLGDEFELFLAGEDECGTGHGGLLNFQRAGRSGSTGALEVKALSG